MKKLEHKITIKVSEEQLKLLNEERGDETLSRHIRDVLFTRKGKFSLETLDSIHVMVKLFKDALDLPKFINLISEDEAKAIDVLEKI